MCREISNTNLKNNYDNELATKPGKLPLYISPLYHFLSGTMTHNQLSMNQSALNNTHVVRTGISRRSYHVVSTLFQRGDHVMCAAANRVSESVLYFTQNDNQS